MDSVLKFPQPATNNNRSQEIATLLRGVLGEHCISQTELARMMHTNKASISRRLKGEFPWRIDELELICELLSLDLDEVLAGKRTTPRPDNPDGGAQSRLPESNRRPYHYMSCVHTHRARGPGVVTELRRYRDAGKRTRTGRVPLRCVL